MISKTDDPILMESRAVTRYRCEWAGDLLACQTEATGYVEFNGGHHPLCDKHLDPKLHPPGFAKHGRLHPAAEVTKPCIHTSHLRIKAGEKVTGRNEHA